MHPPILRQSVKQHQSLKQIQHLIMTQEMQQALNFLQLPIMELQPLIEAELEENPVLEYEGDESEQNEEEIEEDSDNENQELEFNDKDTQILQQLDDEFRDHFESSGTTEKSKIAEDEKLKNYLDSLICQKATLFTHLLSQAKEIFDDTSDRKMAEILIGHFDKYGFIETPLSEISLLNNFDEVLLRGVLKKIKTLDPAGIGASNLQESLLIQLERQGKKTSPAYKIIEHHYDDLLHNRIPLIKKGLGYSENVIAQAISQDIAKLDLHPGLRFAQEVVPYATADITIKEEGDEFIIFVNEDPLPPLRLNPRYIKLLEDETLSDETKEFINKKILSAKWLLKNLTERNETLVRIAHVIVKKQKTYLQEPHGKLTPMTMMEIAEELSLHESTIARAVSNKYINTPRGLKLLRSFFTNGYIVEDGSDMSSQTVKDEVLEIIKHENKKKPLSDDAISKLLEAKGIPCARRTIAKYRYALNFGNAQQRKQF
jgi:RNA polymerase sigma-54 factor